MRSITFDYKIYKGIPSPIIPVKIKGIEFEAYVDSGAFFSIFSSQEAELLGLDIKKGKRRNIIVGDGNKIESYFFNFMIEVAGIRFRAEIGFSPKLGIGINLIGRKDIFKHFRITFDEKNFKIIFSPYNRHN